MDGHKINQTITIDVKVLMAIKGRTKSRSKGDKNI